MGRLIDADKFKKYLRRYLHYGHAIPWVDAQPTAYDLDKVVKELEDKTELAYQRYLDCPYDSPCNERYRTQYQERKLCLEIVKGGGVK